MTTNRERPALRDTLPVGRLAFSIDKGRAFCQTAVAIASLRRTGVVRESFVSTNIIGALPLKRVNQLIIKN